MKYYEKRFVTMPGGKIKRWVQRRNNRWYWVGPSNFADSSSTHVQYAGTVDGEDRFSFEVPAIERRFKTDYKKKRNSYAKRDLRSINARCSAWATNPSSVFEMMNRGEGPFEQ